MRARYAICVVLLMLSRPLFADEESKPVEPIKKRTFKKSVGIEVPLATKLFPRNPYGFSNYLTPPISFLGDFGMDFAVAKGRLHLFFNGEFNVSTEVPYSAGITGTEVSGGLRFKMFDGGLGILAQFQTLGGKAPFPNSQFYTAWSAVYLWAGAEWEGLRPKITVTSYGTGTSTQISSEESLPTKLNHESSTAVTPSLSFRPFEFLEILGELDFITLGASGVASKEFAYAIPASSVTRYNVGLGFHFDPWEVWVRYSSLDKISDLSQHYYQSPYLYHWYLLAPQVLTVQIKWSF